MQSQRFPEILLGCVVVRSQGLNFAEMIQALRDGQVIVAKNAAAPLHGFADHGVGRVIEAQAGIHSAHRVHERRLDLRLVGKLFIDALGTLIQNFSCRNRVAERFARVGDLEQAHHEVGGLPGGLCLDLGDPALFFGLDPREVSRDGESRCDGHADQCRCRQYHHAPLAAMHFASRKIVITNPEHAGEQLEFG